MVIGRDNKPYIAVSGFYSYESDKGPISVKYEADEDGYREIESVALPAAALGSLVGGGLGK